MSAVQFKVGDRVRLVNTIYGSKNEKVGDEFTVLFVSDGGALYVHTDGVRPLSGGGWSKGVRDGWLPHRFEKIKPKRDYAADHARRTLRAFGFNKKHAAMIVQALQHPDTRPYEDYPLPTISGLSRKVPGVYAYPGHELTPGDFLLHAFTWNTAPEGPDVWSQIHDSYATKETHAQAQ